MSKVQKMGPRAWVKSGSPFVWLNAGAIAICIVMVIGLLAWIAYNGLGYFSPKPIVVAEYKDHQFGGREKRLIGVIRETASVPASVLAATKITDEGREILGDADLVERHAVKIGHKFTNVVDPWLEEKAYPEEVYSVERTVDGEIYGFIWNVKEKVKVVDANGNVVKDKFGRAVTETKIVAGKPVTRDANGKVTTQLSDEDHQALKAAMDERRLRAADLRAEVLDIEKHQIGGVNYDKEMIRRDCLKVRYYNDLQMDCTELLGTSAWERMYKKVLGTEPLAVRYFQHPELAPLLVEDDLLNVENEALIAKRNAKNDELQRDSYSIELADGTISEQQLANVVFAFQPNGYGFFDKVGHFFHKIWEFVSDDPREANSEGGVFPAIFGTVLMVILMAIVVTPFGVVAAIYLHEYAKQGRVTQMVRIAVNNLAGVPSIVFGVFGLGFFVYVLGGSIDEMFYPYSDTPVFGSAGILWAALTLALLTLPVVIVSTEEGLSRISRAVREGSLALGATKAETLWRVILPMASPGIMTGLILAIARAAGEVAPLMLVGVVKLAPNLPVDGNAPFLHLDRQFMHLGFHIYDVGFQSPNSEAARPLVYATSLLLVILIISLNLAAVRIRNRLREKFRALQH